MWVLYYLNSVYIFIYYIFKKILKNKFSVFFLKIDDETRRAVDRITNQRRKQAEFVEVPFPVLPIFTNIFIYL